MLKSLTLQTATAFTHDAFSLRKTINCHTTSHIILYAKASDHNESEHNDTPVTRDMFLKDMLEDPKVVRRKKKGYKVLDNRDSLPFVVKVVTPDPYKRIEEMKKEAEYNTRKHKKSPSMGGKKDKSVQIDSRLYKRKTDGSLDRVIGEFSLDKNTNCGDVIEVGETMYEVQKARCQYKYAGGKRFVMVRKILEVKDVTRVAQERILSEKMK